MSERPAPKVTTIWRFDFTPDDEVSIAAPLGARFLHVAASDRVAGDLTVWAEVNPHAPSRLRRLAVVGTGNPFDPTGKRHLGSASVGWFVWHVYEQPQAMAAS